MACTVFVLCLATAIASPAQTFTILENFDGTDGANPFNTGSFVQGTDGNFYGINLDGGASGNCTGGCGTVFKITPAGTLTTLHSFDRTDGRAPSGGLIQATNGDFYGTTFGGGANKDGTVFSLSVGLGPFVETEPTSGKVGAKIGILGQGFTSSSIVKFGGRLAHGSRIDFTSLFEFGGVHAARRMFLPQVQETLLQGLVPR